jgi:2-hydroxy-3-keto-5-methylthiopentenyl-1-phosphate phosphatase
MKIYNCEQRSPEWYQLRCGKITASDFHILFGDSWTKHNILFQKAFERLTGKLQGPKIWTEDIQRGIDLEPQAREMYEKIKNVKVQTVGFVEYNATAGASPDGLIGTNGGLEIKNPNFENFYRKTLKQYIEPSHKTQCHVNMFFTDREWWDYMMYSAGEEPYIERIYRDAAMDKKIIQTIESSEKIIERNIRTIVYTRGLKRMRVWPFIAADQQRHALQPAYI